MHLVFRLYLSPWCLSRFLSEAKKVVYDVTGHGLHASRLSLLFSIWITFRRLTSLALVFVLLHSRLSVACWRHAAVRASSRGRSVKPVFVKSVK